MPRFRGTRDARNLATIRSKARAQIFYAGHVYNSVNYLIAVPSHDDLLEKFATAREKRVPWEQLHSKLHGFDNPMRGYLTTESRSPTKSRFHRFTQG